MNTRPNVAIIGAGFAGLRCADILIQNGARVTIFEARDRVGGRVCYGGPNWIHGAGANPILEIAQATRTTLHDFEGSQLVFGSDGKALDERVAVKISEVLWATIDEAFTYSNSHKDDIPAEKSLLEFIRERLQGTDLNEDEKQLCIDAARLWGCYIGDPIERQSLKFFSLEESIDGSNYFVASTYRDILAQVSNIALNHADIRLNQPVINIHSKPIIQGTSTRREITLTTQAGERHAFDEVVVTCPLGWLKRNKQAFTPDIPPRLSSAIDAISYGRLEKVYITFPEAFWHTKTAGDTVVLPTVNATAANGTNAKLSFAQFLNPSYHTNHPEEIPWDQECFSLAALPDNAAHPTLLFYTYGPCATYIVDQLSSLSSSTSTSTTNSQSHPPNSKQYNFLNTLFAPFYSLLPNYTPNTKICTPTSILATTWQSDPHAGHGSYANFQVGLVDGNKDIETLRGGMGLDRGVWFAGEHTAPFVALGTTTGALWSGERAAGQICALYRLGRVGMGVERDDSLPSGSASAGAGVAGGEGGSGKGGSGFRVGAGNGNGTVTGVGNGGKGRGKDVSPP
ncbi:hypothetical protein BDW66DRAFT_157545 [Aspergillus desertorum]